MNKEKKNIRGITLIALVITVIVLLILAGVTIAALSGDNGILTRAKDAKEKTEQAQHEEEKMLSNMENLLGSYSFRNVNTADTNPAGTVPENSVVLDDDANNGIVIKDINNNEWVWVEVPKITVFGDLTIDTTKELTERNYTDIKNKLVDYAGVYRNGSASQDRSSWTDEWYAIDGETLITASTENLSAEQKELKNGCGLNYDEYNTLYNNMLKSIYTYGGFWIGRYEAGVEGSINDLNKARTRSSDRITIGTSPKAISQKDAIPYNFVYCSEAQSLANEMYPDNNYISSLIFGIQWDITCKYLEVKSDLSISDINLDSSSWGNYNNVTRKITSLNAKKSLNSGNTWEKISGEKSQGDVILSTGASDETKKMNIYDFTGNLWKWTLEKTEYIEYPCASRGGAFNSTGKMSASLKGGNTAEFSSEIVAFRSMLIKK